MTRDHKIKVGSSTVGRYLKEYRLTNRKIGEKNRRAWIRRKLGTKGIPLRERPPQGLADAAPGSLIAKDMKLIAKLNQNTHTGLKAGDVRDHHFWYQHTAIDSCSRYRVLSFVPSSDAKAARDAYEEASLRFPFSTAAMLTDNGSENAGVFQTRLQGSNILQFWSRPGTPTDNPRVERSHRSDDDEFYAFHGEARMSLETLKTTGLEREKIWNDVRPHQALGYLTPKEFCELWKKDQPRAEQILTTWNQYLNKQSKRLRVQRKEKRAERIQALNTHLNDTLGSKFTHLKV